MNKSLFKKIVKNYYKKHRRNFPWRETRNPYKILISEIMLQQTQAKRVIKKYSRFVATFPNFRALSRASTEKVLRVWQGLGYNRRALRVKAIAGEVMRRFNGKLPKETGALVALPGIGQSTAGALRAFAFNLPSVFIETNVRAVFIHHFFKNKKKIYDSDILTLVKRSLDIKNPREWYWALMDYGAWLKQHVGNINRRSAGYAKQSPFMGSGREQRSKILKAVLGGARSLKKIQEAAGFSITTAKKHLRNLECEGFLAQRGWVYKISEG